MRWNSVQKWRTILIGALLAFYRVVEAEYMFEVKIPLTGALH